jgi:hypothetical protein
MTFTTIILKKRRNENQHEKAYNGLYEIYLKHKILHRRIASYSVKP